MLPRLARMNDRRPVTGKETRPSEAAQESGTGFRADLPLAILESVRHHDRPAEVLEDEDLAASLPRRLGLTGVVESQIHRYRIARKRRERIPFADVSDLLKLVLRRPDSEAILREAGHDLARHHGRMALYRLAPLARILPDPLSEWFAARSLRRLMNRIGGGTPLRVERAPLRVEAETPVTAQADKYGVACVLYGAAIEEAAQHAIGRRPAVTHVACEARGDERCVWEVE
jgi:predicted hydrocarbon binding protein